MHYDAFSSLTLSRYRLRLRAREATTLPAFLGSTLRGAFVHALKRAVCIMDHRDCTRCLVAERCLYPYLFETPAPPDLPQLRGQQQAPHPFILVPPVIAPPNRENGRVRGFSQERAGGGGLPDGGEGEPSQTSLASYSDQRQYLSAGDELSFGLVLVGRAIEHLPYVIYAMRELAWHGLGASRVRFELSEVAALDERGMASTIYSENTQRLAQPDMKAKSLSEFISPYLEQKPNLETLKLHFLTPTRIKVAGDLRMGMSFGLLARNLLRRISLLMAVHGRAPLDLDYRALLERAAQVETRSSSLRWWDWERYSNRQQVKMKLGGFVGEIEYAGQALEEFFPLIVAGELLHIGTGTSFGLGLYHILF